MNTHSRERKQQKRNAAAVPQLAFSMKELFIVLPFKSILKVLLK